MPAILANARKFLANSDYPFDKVVYLKTGSYTVPNNTIGQTVTIPHGLPFTPLIGGNWALMPSFTVAYEYSTGPFPSSAAGYLFDTRANAYADATNVYVSTDNLNPSAKTVYYRIFGFQPSTSDADVPGIASQGDSFLFNTDFNYTKLYLSGFVDTPATTDLSVNVPIAHGLGYIPQVSAWVSNATYIFPVGSSHSFASSTLASANGSHLNFTIKPFNDAQRAHYRIYLDS